MPRGRIVQIDRPGILDDRTRIAFVPQCLGATTLLPACAAAGGVRLIRSGKTLTLPDASGGAGQVTSDMAACLLAIRPETVARADPGETGNPGSATLERCCHRRPEPTPRPSPFRSGLKSPRPR